MRLILYTSFSYSIVMKLCGDKFGVFPEKWMYNISLPRACGFLFVRKGYEWCLFLVLPQYDKKGIPIELALPRPKNMCSTMNTAPAVWWTKLQRTWYWKYFSIWVQWQSNVWADINTTMLVLWMNDGYRECWNIPLAAFSSFACAHVLEIRFACQNDHGLAQWLFWPFLAVPDAKTCLEHIRAIFRKHSTNSYRGILACAWRVRITHRCTGCPDGTGLSMLEICWV